MPQLAGHGRAHGKAGVLGLLMALAAPLAQADSATAGTTPSSQSPALSQDVIRAQLLPRRYTTLAAEIAARVTRLTVPEGAAFKVGQPLVTFDCSLPKAQLRRAQVEVSGAKQVFASNRKLASLNSVGQLELDISETAVAKAEAEVGVHQAMLSKCTIPAPFSGRVAEQKIREDQFAQVGQPLLEIIDDQSLELEFLVPSRWLTWLKTGRALTVHIDETNKVYPARFTRLGARIDPVSQSVKVAATIDGNFPELVAGMSGQIETQVP